MPTYSKIAVIAIVLTGTCSASCQKAKFSLNLSTPQSSVKSGADIPVAITVKNVSDHELRLLVSSGETGIGMDYWVTLLDGLGNPVPETPVGICVHGKDTPATPFLCGIMTFSRGFVLIPIGGEDKSTTHVNLIFDLTKPGNYTVQVQRLDKATNVMVKSNKLAFTVTP